MAEDNCPSPEALEGYCTGQLPSELQATLERHLAGCKTCQAMIETFDTRSDTLISELRLPASSDEFREESGLQKLMADAAKLIQAPHQAADTLAGLTPSSGTPQAPPAMTAEQFAAASVASGLMAESAIRDFLAARPSSEQPADGKSLALALVNAGMLTPFQARAIFYGYGRGLSLGDREILDLVGRGGMGHVYRARHRRLDRIEAVKVLSAERLNSPQAVARFEREARAAAKVEHEHVVRTYDAGEQAGVYYLAMEYVEGQDLATFVRDHGPLPLPQAVSCTIQAARGLHAAHDAKIIHRDVKPHNLLLAVCGQRSAVGESEVPDSKSTFVKLLDLGLARIAGDAARLEETSSTVTSDGQIMGTLDYISPEQIVDTHSADVRSDIYSLGCTFYFLLTGRPPYEGKHPIEKIDAHRSAPIPKVAITLRRDESCPLDLPNDKPSSNMGAPTPEAHHAERDGYLSRLNAALEKLLAKSPADRPQTMTEVITLLESICPPEPLVIPATSADTIDSNLNDLLDNSDPSSFIHFPGLQPATPVAALRFRRRRHIPRLALAFALGFLPILLLGVIVLKFNTPMGDVEIVFPNQAAADSVEIALLRGGKQVKVVKPGEWQFQIKEGRYEIQMQAGEDRFQLEDGTLTVGKSDEPALIRVTLRPVPELAKTLPAERVFPEMVVSEKFVLEGHGKWVRSMVFSRDGRNLLSAADDRTVRLWDVENRRQLCSLEGHDHKVTDVAFLTDERFAVSSSDDDTLILWDLQQRRLVRRFVGHPSDVISIAASPDGKHIASSGHDFLVRVWNVEDGSQVQQLRGHKWSVQDVTYSPDGHWIATGGGDSSVSCWNAKSGERLWSVKPGYNWIRVTFSPKGKYVVTWGKSLHVWEAGTGQLVRHFDSDGMHIGGLAFLDSEDLIAASYDDGSLCLWSVISGAQLQQIDLGAPVSRAVTKVGNRLFVGATNETGEIEVYRLQTTAADRAASRRGLDAELFGGRNFDEFVLQRTDGQLDWLWGFGPPDMDMPEERFSARWTSWIKAPDAGNYKLVAIADDAVRIWIDDKLVIDSWVDSIAARRYADVEFTGKPQRIVVEHNENDGSAMMSLRIADEYGDFPVPADWFYLDEEAAAAAEVAPVIRPQPTESSGLVAKYFEGANFDKLHTRRIDQQVNFLWGWEEAAPGLPLDQYSVRWHGELTPPVAGEYEFEAWVDDVVRVWIGDQLILEREKGGYPVVLSGECSLEAKPYPIRIEYQEFRLSAVVSLRWKLPDTDDFEIIPLTALSHTNDDVEAASMSTMPEGITELDLDVVKPEEFLQRLASGLSNESNAGKRFVVGTAGTCMAWIKPGDVTMGGQTVHLSTGFWMSQCEVTQQEWLRVMKTNPSRIIGSPHLPVNGISWHDAIEFCARLSDKEREVGRLPDGYEYRLPTEAEWEWASRADGNNDFGINPEQIAWHGNGATTLRQVGETIGSIAGLYDMHGNVPEWCFDAWETLPSESVEPIVNRFVASSDERRGYVVRGGGVWSANREECGSSARIGAPSDRSKYFGLRIVLAPIIDVDDEKYWRWTDIDVVSAEVLRGIAAKFHDDFSNSTSGVPTGGGHGYKDGTYYINESWGGWNLPAGRPRDFAIELAGRTSGSGSGLWGISISGHGNHGAYIGLTTDRTLRVARPFWDADKDKEPYLNQSISDIVAPTEEWNRLFVVARANKLDIFINGQRASATLDVDHDLNSAVLALWGLNDGGSEAVFNEVKLWGLDQLGSLID